MAKHHPQPTPMTSWQQFLAAAGPDALTRIALGICSRAAVPRRIAREAAEEAAQEAAVRLLDQPFDRKNPWGWTLCIVRTEVRRALLRYWPRHHKACAEDVAQMPAPEAPVPLEVLSLESIRAAAGSTFRYLEMEAAMPAADAAAKGAALGVTADVFRTLVCRARVRVRRAMALRSA